MHLFFYLLVSLLLVFFLTYLPALTLFPRLIIKPLYFSAVPIISYFIIGVLGFVLRFFACFHHWVVVGVMSVFLLGFIVRTFFEKIWRLLYKELEWKKIDFGLLTFNFFFLLPLIFLAIYSAFSQDDGLASWNYWAKLYYFSQTSEQSLYPTLYPSFLSVAYQLLGSFEAQGVVKVLLVIFQFSILNAMVFSAKQINRHILAYICVAILVLFPGDSRFGMYHFSISGYADPILAGVMAISVASFIAYSKESNRLSLFIVVISAIAAAWTKQPGLLWAGFTLPIALIYKMVSSKKSAHFVDEIIALCASLAAVFYWAFNIGRHFYENQGVLGTSKAYYAHGGASLTYPEVFLHSVWHYLIYQPPLLFLLVLASVSAFQQAYMKIILFSLVWVGFVLWFVVASYELREGLYLIAVCGVLIAANNYAAFSSWRLFKRVLVWFLPRTKGLFILFAILSVLLSIVFVRLALNRVHNNIFPSQAGKTLFYNYFVDQPEKAYQTLYQDKSVLVGGVSNYENGLFFGQKKVIGLYSTTPEMMLADLQRTRVKYVFISPGISHEQFRAILALSLRCPKQVTKLDWGRTRSGYNVFQIDQISDCKI